MLAYIHGETLHAEHASAVRHLMQAMLDLERNRSISEQEFLAVAKVIVRSRTSMHTAVDIRTHRLE